MTPADTSMGGCRESFPETVWSSVLASPDAPARSAHLNQLFARYWRPVYRCIRAAWNCPSEDAKDLTQEFFCHVVDKDLVSKYVPERGRFRSFLKGALRTFLAETHRDNRRVKRGGGRTIVSLDMTDTDRDAPTALAPDDAFDRQWMHDVVTAAVEQLRKELAQEGKDVYFKILEAYEFLPDERARPTYDELALTFGVGVYDVQNYLRAARERLHRCVLRTVTSYVASSEELEREMKELFGR